MSAKVYVRAIRKNTVQTQKLFIMDEVIVNNLGASAERCKDIYHISFTSEKALNQTRRDLDHLKIHYVILLGHIFTDESGCASLKEYNTK